MTSWRTYLTCLATLGLALGACSDGGGNGKCSGGGLNNCPQPRMDFQPSNDPIVIAESAIAVGESDLTEIDVINTGFATLTLDKVTLKYTAPDGVTESEPAFVIDHLDADLPAQIEPFGGTSLPQRVRVFVKFTRQADTTPRTATVVLDSDDPFVTDGILEVHLATVLGAPSLITQPLQVKFTIVPQGQTVSQDVSLVNGGSRTLHVGGFRIADDARFGVKSAEYGFDLKGPDGIEGISLEHAIEIPAGESRKVTVTFSSDSIAPAEGRLIVYSDDPATGDTGYVVPLEANKDGACLAVRPTKLEFGGKKVGQTTNLSFEIQSCGTQELVVDDVAFLTGSSPDFELDFSTLAAGFETGPSTSNPLHIPAGDKVTVGVTFTPDTVNPRDADNVPIPDEGKIQIHSNAYLSSVEVPVRGAGSAVECPTPVIVVTEGEEVIPQTVIHLDARNSYAPFGAITDYFWTITSFPDALSAAPTMVPNRTTTQPAVELDVVGTYTFSLNVTDETGERSGTDECPDATYVVLVQPDQAIHVELTWETPTDPDPNDTGDGKGTDLDLHFAHQYATGPDIDGDGSPDPWFDFNQDAGTGWDVFWYNNAPDWASFGSNAKDDPSLDRDDTDGTGPENLSLSVPEDNVTYTIGVHFWNDWGFGLVNARVRVFHYADLVYDVTYDGLKEYDMWCVGRIHWPTIGVERCAADGDPEVIHPNYINPFFRPPNF